MYRLYHSPGACSLAVHIVLEEIGLPYEAEIRSAKNGEGTTTPDYLALNPKGRVPALSGVPGSAGGAANLLTEAPAILFFLAASHPDCRLMPADPAGRARCLEWMNWLSGTLHGMGYGQLWRPQRVVTDTALYDAVKSAGLEIINAAHDHIEHVLSDGRDWAVPGQYTIVDAYLVVFWLWGGRIGLDMETAWPLWARLMRTVLARPAVREALAQERLA
ncbi:glutathione binding-like protein [Rhizobiaceae bacterium BDR2-2]|uniref:Glutathione binding-like protein n=1 Tax=Ectorhizobium quercum TaxID=2965071 RepID=A0AAE3SY67_9HYPH|nr:glutathione binding-like protein [Ectorhizobium quercum]MCX8999849.1 glutathione binding-like protein [Ectorhizobium quercum]